jgi:sulfoquinovose isomerase
MPRPLPEHLPDQLPDHLVAELRAEADRLLAFGRAARTAVGGFGHLDQRGRLDRTAPIQTFAVCRMVYSYTLGVLTGHDSDAELVAAGIAALRGELHDAEHGGWYTSLSADGTPLDAGKQAYTHAFVLLAAASARTIDACGSVQLFDGARAVIDAHFWDEDAGVMRESFDRGWAHGEAYRGANANMHTTEALLAAASVAAEPALLQRAERIAARFVDGFARTHGWRLPEHYSAALSVQADYNHDDPMHRFRPFGVTPGHLFEWGRLCVQLAAARSAAGLDTDWHRDAAEALYDRGVADGWCADGRSGFVYTVDFAGRPVARTRMAWVVAEAMSAAAVLYEATGDPRYLADFNRWWAEGRQRFVDPVDGSWHHALDETNRPAPEVWGGKPDLYHALQAVLLPGTRLAPSLPAALTPRPGS